MLQVTTSTNDRDVAVGAGAQAPHFGLEGFKRSSTGRQVCMILTSAEGIARMRGHCELGIPAVQAIARALMIIGVDLSSTSTKQHIGRWVREIMIAAGWCPIRTARVSPGHGFATGAVYAPRP